MSKRIYTDTDKQHVLLEFERTGNIGETARRTGIPKSTVNCWIHQISREELAAAKDRRLEAAAAEAAERIKDRDKKFIDRTSNVIDKGVELLEQMIDDELKARANGTSDGKMTVNQLSTAIGTIYDKRALAKGETTQNTGITVSLPPEVAEFAK